MSGFGWFLVFISPLLVAVFACFCAIGFFIVNALLLDVRDALSWWRR